MFEMMVCNEVMKRLLPLILVVVLLLDFPVSFVIMRRRSGCIILYTACDMYFNYWLQCSTGYVMSIECN